LHCHQCRLHANVRVQHSPASCVERRPVSATYALAHGTLPRSPVSPYTEHSTHEAEASWRNHNPTEGSRTCSPIHCSSSVGAPRLLFLSLSVSSPSTPSCKTGRSNFLASVLRIVTGLRFWHQLCMHERAAAIPMNPISQPCPMPHTPHNTAAWAPPLGLRALTVLDALAVLDVSRYRRDRASRDD